MQVCCDSLGLTSEEPPFKTKVDIIKTYVDEYKLFLTSPILLRRTDVVDGSGGGNWKRKSF